MCHFRLDKPAIEARYGIDFDSLFADELERLEPMAADGLVEMGPQRIEVTPRGRLLVRNIAMTFDGYLRAGNAARYSRTV
jgi:oxygen-independent coproporphyrinogen-3 oxidase